MTESVYPHCFSFLTEEEMVYTTGGTSASDVPDQTFWRIAMGVVIVVGIVGGIAQYKYEKTERRLREQYEAETGLSAVSSHGTLTSDFKNYQKRAEEQGRDAEAQADAHRYQGIYVASVMGFYVIPVAIGSIIAAVTMFS